MFSQEGSQKTIKLEVSIDEKEEKSVDYAIPYEEEYSDDDEEFLQLSKGVECFDKDLIINPEGNEEFIENSTCPVCLNLIKDLCQCQMGCQQLFGYNCVKHQAVQGCPLCRKQFDNEKLVYKNEKIEKMQKGVLKLKCQFHKNGCQEELEYYTKSIEEHEKICEYKVVKCPYYMVGCKWEGKRKEVEKHQQDCDFKQYKCVFCKKQGDEEQVLLKKQLKDHFQFCFNKQVHDLGDLINKKIQILESNQSENQRKQENESNYIENRSRKQSESSIKDKPQNNKKPSQQQQKQNVKNKNMGSIDNQELLDIFSQTQKILRKQQEKIQFMNRQMQEMIKYQGIIEPNEDKARDYKFLLNDFKNGIINFNSLENLKTTLDALDPEFVQGVRWNENCLQCYQFSFRSKSDFKPVLKKIENFASSGDKYSQYSLARLYIFGDKDIPRNVDKALNWVEKSIEQNCAEGKYLLGRIQHNSQEKEEDDFQSLIELINQASRQGNPEAKNFLGFVYGKGEGIAQDQRKALEYYKKASLKGNFAALLNLGSYYEGGYGGLEVNPNLSYDYYEKSAKKGYINAMSKVVNCLKGGKGIEQDDIKALKWEYRIQHYNEFYTHSIQWERERRSERQQQQQQQH